MLFKLNLNEENRVLSVEVSEEKKRKESDIIFPETYLKSIGIACNGKSFVRVDGHAQAFIYDFELNVIKTKANPEIQKNEGIARAEQEYQEKLRHGVVWSMETEELRFPLTLEDQIGLIQALDLAKLDGTAKVKAFSNGSTVASMISLGLDKLQDLQRVAAYAVVNAKTEFYEEQARITLDL